MFRIRLIAFVVMCIAPSAHAQVLHFTSKHWRVFTTKQNGDTVCYIASVPTSKKGNYKKRGKPFVLVTHRGAKVDEVSVSSGYPYDVKKEVAVTIDKQRHQLFTQGERGWAKDSKTDTVLVSRMKAGNNMTVRGTSKLGTYSTDTYSLSGFTIAYNKMKKLCT